MPVNQKLLEKLIRAKKYEVETVEPDDNNLIIEGDLKAEFDAVLQNGNTAALDDIYEKVKLLCKRKSEDPEARKIERVANPFMFWDLVCLVAIKIGNRAVESYAREQMPCEARIFVDGKDISEITIFPEMAENRPGVQER